VANAASLANKLDLVADQVYGQFDFTSNSVPITVTGSSLNQPNDIFMFDSGQIFVADTANNRVLGWNCVYSYTNGDYADFVLGQPDFETTTPLYPPTATSMNAPTGVTVGFDGLLYVSDTGNNRVLVFFPTNYIDYVNDAEIYYDPNRYYCADDWWFPSDFYAPIYNNGQEADYALGQPDFTTGTALPTGSATLSSPMGLVTDVNDNLVVADHGNNRVLVYEWNESGTIGPNATWVVGQEISGTGNAPFTFNAAPNPPTQRSMNGPTRVAADLLGDAIYVADTGNNRVLFFNANPIDNVADGLIGQPDYSSNSPNNGGLSAVSLNGPTGLKLDAGNRLYVADTNNNRVLLFDRLNPDGQADEVIGQPDFISNTANNGGLDADSLYAPQGIAVDDSYLDLFIADTGNNRALQYNQPLDNPTPNIAILDPGTIRAGADSFTLDIWGSGIISATVVEVNGVARTTGSEFLGFTEVAINASEVITTGQLTVTLRNPAPGGVSTPITLTIYTPTPQDDLADSVLGQRGFTTNWGPFASVSPDTLFNPAGIAVDPTSGRLFVADTWNARVLSWSSSQAQQDGSAADLVIGKPDFTTYYYEDILSRNLGRPTGLALDSLGNLYVADAQENAVLIYTQPFTNGMNADLIISGLFNPLDIALDSADNLYVADTFNHRILFYSTPLSSDTAPDAVFGQPNMTSTDPNAGGSISADTLHYPSGVTLDDADNLYVADSNNHRILVYLAASGDATADTVFGQDGDFTTGVPNKGGLSAESLNYPYGLLVDSNDNLYVADMDNNRLLGYADPLVTNLAADLIIGQASVSGQGAINQGSLHGPTAIGLNANSDLFVADTGNSRILSFNGVSPTTTCAPPTLSGITAIYAHPNVEIALGDGSATSYDVWVDNNPYFDPAFVTPITVFTPTYTDTTFNNSAFYLAQAQNECNQTSAYSNRLGAFNYQVITGQ
ncbi:MAG TPA: NHL repeat-containing protein, partial [Anaerolineae bacterium]|nr:NHL repeat-containing protein [Anaerolineae bacterium]